MIYYVCVTERERRRGGRDRLVDNICLCDREREREEGRDRLVENI